MILETNSPTYLKQKTLVQHNIKLTDAGPIRCPPYTTPFAVRETVRRDVASMIKMAVICTSLSPYAVSRTDDEGSRDDLAIDLSGISNLRNWTSANVIGKYP